MAIEAPSQGYQQGAEGSSNYEAGYNGSGNSSMGGVAAMLQEGSQHGLAATHHMQEGRYAATDADRAVSGAKDCYDEAESYDREAAKAQESADTAKAEAAAAEEERARAAAEEQAAKAQERADELRALAEAARQDARRRLTRAQEIGEACLKNFIGSKASARDAQHVFRGALMGTTNDTGLRITALANDILVSVTEVLGGIKKAIQFVGKALNNDRLPARDYDEKFVTSVEALIPEEKAMQGKMLGVLAAEYAVVVLL